MKATSIIRKAVIYPLLLNFLPFFGVFIGHVATLTGQPSIGAPPLPEAGDKFIPPTPVLFAIRTTLDKPAAMPVSSGFIITVLTVKMIAQVDDLDLAPGDQADFVLGVEMKNPTRSATAESPVWENQDEVKPNWQVRCICKKNESTDITVRVWNRESVLGKETGRQEVDINPDGGNRALAITIKAEAGKSYTYTKEGNEGPGFLKPGIRAKIEIGISTEDMFVQMAMDGQELIRSFSAIANYYAPSLTWGKSPWGNWAQAMTSAFSARTEAAMIELAFYVAADGLLTPVALAANHIAAEFSEDSCFYRMRFLNQST